MALLLITVFIFREGFPIVIKSGINDFLFSTKWAPTKGHFGILSMIISSISVPLGAMVLGVPLSLACAITLAEFSPPRLMTFLKPTIELLAGIPSIIYGMWGLFIFAPWFGDNVQPWINDKLGALPVVGESFQGPPLGIGMLTSGIILAIMVIPFIASVMRDVFEIVPSKLKESAYGLGATTWEVVWTVVLPYTKVGVIGGIMLGLGRALGETMAVTFVIGNAHELSKSLLMPGNSIASALATEFTEAVRDLYTSALRTSWQVTRRPLRDGRPGPPARASA